MDERTQLDLLRRLSALERRQVRLRQGVMTDTDAVAVGGSDVPFEGVTVLNGDATTGDRVAVLMVANDCLVLGRVAGSV